MRQVVQSGTPTEMGLQHGAAFADLIPSGREALCARAGLESGAPEAGAAASRAQPRQSVP